MATKEAVKHTPGPWEMLYSPDDGRLLQIAGPCREHKHCHKTVLFHSAHTPSGEDGFQHDPNSCHCLANARLIAAAPEMLEALKAVTGAWVQCNDDNLSMAIDRALKLIAKAEGR